MKAIREGTNLIIVDFFDKQFQDYSPFYIDIRTVSSVPFTSNLVVEMYVSISPRLSVVKEEVYKVHIRPNNSINTYKVSVIWEDGTEKKVNVYPLDKNLPVYTTYAKFDTTDFRGKEYNRLCTLIEEAWEFWYEHNKSVQGE